MKLLMEVIAPPAPEQPLEVTPIIMNVVKGRSIAAEFTYQYLCNPDFLFADLERAALEAIADAMKEAATMKKEHYYSNTKHTTGVESTMLTTGSHTHVGLPATDVGVYPHVLNRGLLNESMSVAPRTSIYGDVPPGGMFA